MIDAEISEMASDTLHNALRGDGRICGMCSASFSVMIAVELKEFLELITDGEDTVADIADFTGEQFWPWLMPQVSSTDFGRALSQGGASPPSV